METLLTPISTVPLSFCASKSFRNHHIRLTASVSKRWGFAERLSIRIPTVSFYVRSTSCHFTFLNLITLEKLTWSRWTSLTLDVVCYRNCLRPGSVRLSYRVSSNGEPPTSESMGFRRSRFLWTPVFTKAPHFSPPFFFCLSSYITLQLNSLSGRWCH